jgi:hypothetical protein
MQRETGCFLCADLLRKPHHTGKEPTMQQMDDVEFEDLMGKPYRAWIGHYLETLEPAEMERELGEIIALFPDPIYDGMQDFMEAAMRLFVGHPGNWEIPGMDAAALIAALADEKLPAAAAIAGDERDAFYGAIFDMVTLFFSAQGAGSAELREIMGLT